MFSTTDTKDVFLVYMSFFDSQVAIFPEISLQNYVRIYIYIYIYIYRCDFHIGTG